MRLFVQNFYKHSLITFLSILLVFFPAVSAEKDSLMFYKVQTGDHLLKILRTFYVDMDLDEKKVSQQLANSNIFLQKRRIQNQVQAKDKIYFSDLNKKSIFISQAFDFFKVEKNSEFNFDCSEKNLNQWIDFKRMYSFENINPLDEKWPTLALDCSKKLNKAKLAESNQTKADRNIASIGPEIITENMRIEFSAMTSDLNSSNKATNTKSHLISAVNPGIFLAYTNPVSADQAFFISGQFKSLKIYDADKIQIQDQNQKMGGMTLGYIKSFDKLDINLNFNYQDHYYQRRIAGNRIKIDVLPSLGTDLSLQYKFFNFSDITFSAKATYGYSFPTTITIYSKSDFYYSRLNLYANIKLNYDQVIFGFGQENYDLKSESQILNQFKEFSTSVGYKWSLK